MNNFNWNKVKYKAETSLKSPEMQVECMQKGAANLFFSTRNLRSNFFINSKIMNFEGENQVSPENEEEMTTKYR